MKNTHSEIDQIYYEPHYRALVKELEKGLEYYTHHFEFIGVSAFVGKSNRPHLRKCLRTLEKDGIIENINLGSNIHKWKIIKNK